MHTYPKFYKILQNFTHLKFSIIVMEESSCFNFGKRVKKYSQGWSFFQVLQKFLPEKKILTGSV